MGAVSVPVYIISSAFVARCIGDLLDSGMG